MSIEAFAQHAPIHPQSLSDYQRWYDLLRKWNHKINLVAPKSIDQFWTRHALDSAQILPHIPEDAKTIVDFGSGGGFPAIAIAIEAKHAAQPRHVHMIESAGKKASFLRSVSRETSLSTEIHAERIEALPPLNADVITARAFAPLHRILPLADHHIKDTGRLILLKGEAIDHEVEEAKQDWHFVSTVHPSLSDPTGSVLILEKLQRA